jgi:aspartyl protease family protein
MLCRQCLPILIALLISPLLWAQSPSVEVQGLFTDAAVLKVDGKSKMIRVGQSLGGVTLLEANSNSITIELNGERRVLGMSQRISSNYQVPEAREVQILRDERLQYRTKASINGRSMVVLVDTGANIVAMNASHARSIGLDPYVGEPARVETASGVVDARTVMLKSVDVGGIRVENVRATVMKGSHPGTILLGMSYLRHVDIRENGGVLSLSQAY